MDDDRAGSPDDAGGVLSSGFSGAHHHRRWTHMPSCRILGVDPDRGAPGDGRFSPSYHSRRTTTSPAQRKAFSKAGGFARARRANTPEIYRSMCVNTNSSKGRSAVSPRAGRASVQGALPNPSRATIRFVQQGRCRAGDSCVHVSGCICCAHCASTHAGEVGLTVVITARVYGD